MHYKTSLVGLLSGMLFGFGLAFSDMLSPERTIGFFDISGNWDPTLVFAVSGALITSIIGQLLLKKRTGPYFDTKWNFSWEKTGVIDMKLVIGAILFGIGWGLSGFCPGPALGNIVFFHPFLLVFLASMIGSMGIYRFYDQKKS